ncbi:MAG: class I SAM-dependent methyltransferase [Gammaproteobacteria bacterium]
MRLRYQTYEFDQRDLHVRTLRDRQEYDDQNHEAESLGISSAHWSLFGVVWESGEVLARLMWMRDFNGEKILEIGCGIGLASLILGIRSQNISATDRHPQAQRFLDYNTALNEITPIKFERCSWEQPESSLGKFDLIIGSDLLYDRDCIEPLCHFIDLHAETTCEVMLIDPNRGLRSTFSKQMERLGFTTTPRIKVELELPENYNGSILEFNRGHSI